MQLIPTLQHFIAELQRRKVLRVAATYLVGAWVVLQVAVALQTAWSLSPSFSATILNLMVLGFLAAIGLAWFFEITPQGIKRTTTSGDGAIAKLQTTDFVLAGALALVFCVGVAQLFWPRAVVPEASSAAATDVSKPEAEAPGLGDKSIAVLPFANLSPDKNDAFFADGLTEEVLNILARLHGLRVTSRTSSFAFKGKEIGVKEIAQKLGVRHILEGSVRRDGDTVRVTAQLIDTSTDAHVWSETYERKLADVFTVQDEIARSIAGALNIELSVSGPSSGAPTKNMEAYRLYLQAREQASILSDNSMVESIELFKRAIKLDPNFAEAYAHMAATYFGRVTFNPNRSEEFAQEAGNAVDIALRLKPNLATALGIQSSLAMGLRKWSEADESAAKALELEPSNAYTLMMTGHRLLFLGYFEKARKSFERMDQADPLFSLISLRLLMLSYAEGDNEATETYARKLLPFKGLGSYAANGALAHTARERGDLDSAIKFAKQAIADRSVIDFLIDPVSKAMKDPNGRSRAIAKLREASEKYPWFEPDGLLLLIGAQNEALDVMNARASTPGSSMVSAIGFAWHLVARGEGSNPKIKQLFRTMSLVDYWRAHGWPDRCRAKGEDDFECN